MGLHRTRIGIILFHITLALILGASVRHWVICKKLAEFHAQQEKSFLEAASFRGPGAIISQEAATDHTRLRLACEQAAWRPWEAIPTSPNNR
jgi:hypothetical protein